MLEGDSATWILRVQKVLNISALSDGHFSALKQRVKTSTV